MKRKFLFGLILVLGLIHGLNVSTSQSSSTSLVVNYGITQIDKDLRPGDSGTLIVVIQNTGGLEARDVKAWVMDTGNIGGGGIWNIGNIVPGQSTTIKTTITVNKNAYIGMHTIPLLLKYKSYWINNEGMKESKNLETEWQIPIRVYTDVNFQIQPEKTEFYKDVASELIIKGTAKGEIRNLNGEITSNCLTVIGSGKKYLGNLDSNQNFVLNYTIKPNTAGTCSIDISLGYLDNSGKNASENIRIGLSVLEPDVNLKILDVDFGAPSPGDVIDLKIKIKNVGTTAAESVTTNIDLKDPFVPVQTSEVYLENINPGDEKEISFKISINPNAEIKAYKIPLKINYKIGGVEYSDNKSIGVDIVGTVNIEVINVEVVRDKLRIEIANTGTRTAYAIKATLVVGNLTEISYKDKLSPNKQTTFTFGIPKENTGKLILKYTGQNNKRVTFSEDIVIPFEGLQEHSNTSTTQTAEFPLWAILVIIIILVVVIYKFRKHF